MSLDEIAPAVSFELDKTDEFYMDISEACEDLEETIQLYSKNYSYKTEDGFLRDYMTFQEYLEERKRFLDKEDDGAKAQRLAEYKSVDMHLQELIEAREASKKLLGNKQGIGEVRPFKTTRVDLSKSQAVRLVAQGGTNLVHLDADTIIKRHLPSKLLHRVSKLQRKLQEQEEREKLMLQRQMEMEMVAAAQAQDSTEGEEGEEGNWDETSQGEEGEPLSENEIEKENENEDEDED